MRLLPRPRRAESLVESIVAITVVVLSTTAALTLLRTSITGNRVIEEKVVALNLALEGIEAVKNIRDTNYLNFSSKPEDCWNAVDAQDVDDCDTDGSNTADRMEDGDTYYFKWNLRNAAKRLQWTLETNTAYEEISLYEVYDGSGNTIAELYAQTGLETVDAATFGLLDENVFTRSVSFTQNDYKPDDAIDATVTVGWESNGQSYSVSLTRTIANVY